MSTNCLIGITKNNEHVSYISCHWDGYLKDGGVGEKLLKFYKDKETVDRLINLGDISSLGELPESDPELWNTKENDHKYCRAYKDRGDEKIIGYEPLDDYLKASVSYIYLFKDDEWWVKLPGKELQKLKEVID